MYLAHSRNDRGEPQSVADHLDAVAARAESFASVFGAGGEARLAGLLHDLGKYGDLFQQRLRGEACGVDHWSAGAWIAVKKYGALAAALAIHGHHIGLQSADSLKDLDPSHISSHHPLGLKLSTTDYGQLIERLVRDGTSLPQAGKGSYEKRSLTAASMLDVRMLFSALVDADFTDTEAHFACRAPEPDGGAELPLQAEAALAAVQEHLAQLARREDMSPDVRRMRADLLEACLAAAEEEPGLWTLSAPTGAGKTLAMLAFALRHAARYGLRRIVVVIPYLSIIEQTGRVYRSILCPRFGDGYVHEHHSLAGTRPRAAPGPQNDPDGDSESERLERATAEDWAAPVIITTSVQLLESLHANRPSACRKLHRLAHSVLLLDEVQALPDHLAVPTLATLSWLAQRYHVSIVFATATQPAFEHLDPHVRMLGPSGWQAREIVPSVRALFRRVNRTRVTWPDGTQPTPWEEIAERLARQPQALCVVNVKRHAQDLFQRLREAGAEGVLHLSTAMCPAHRQAALRVVRLRLRRGLPCRLISTQCVEAGVDLDFPVVYRALAPLEAIAQAAGRCNRHGLRAAGEVHVFVPEDNAGPPGAYAQATDVTRMLLKQRGPEGMDITDPELFAEYYRSFYNVANSESKRPELHKAIKSMDFAAVAEHYRLIEEESISVLVPYLPRTWQELADVVRSEGLNTAWIRRAQRHAVSVWRPGADDPIWQRLEPVQGRRRTASDEWFILADPDSYHRFLGLLPSDAPPVWLV